MNIAKQVTQNIRVVVGLGNPGREYARTYHNVGRLALAVLEDTVTMTMTMTKKGITSLFEFKVFEPSHGHSQSSLGHGHSYSHSPLGHRYGHRHISDIYLVRPRTYMNLSGPAIASALRYFRAAPAELLILHDDADILLGSYKLVWGGRAAGHHGVESAIAELGTNKFWRLRVGIRPPTGPIPRKPASEIVLTPIAREDERRLYGVLEEAMAKVIEKVTMDPSNRMSVKGKLTDWK